MKVIDLLNKIANGESVPKKIEYLGLIWEYNKKLKDYFNDNSWLLYSMSSIGLTEREVEIIEDTPKEDKKIKRIEERESGWWPNMADGNVSTLKQAVNELIDKINGGNHE